MRRLRLALRMRGLRRSSKVMELIMASILFICRSGISGEIRLLTWERPGMISMSWLKGPSFLTSRSCCRKSSRSNSPLASLSPRAMACSWSKAASAFSIRVRTSPMPRMREARRSGWKGSRASTFSPTPRNLMGTPVTERMEMAAPPRASPSTLVKMRPVRPTRRLNSSATRTASWPVIASATRSTSCGLILALISSNSRISASSMCHLPPVSKMTTL